MCKCISIECVMRERKRECREKHRGRSNVSMETVERKSVY